MLGAVAGRADDARSAVPPYGGSIQSFQAFAKTFGHLVAPSKFLPSICQIKFGGSDRTAMYNLGFTDEDLDRKPLEDLWVEVLTEVHRLASKMN